MLDLRRLDVLHRFAVLGSITAVAAHMGYSPSAVSQQLSTLEREAGVALIERTAHSASLTDAGRDLVQHAAVILGAVESAQAQLRARSEVLVGKVRLSCISGLAARIAPHLASLQRDHPGLSIIARETSSVLAATAVSDRRSDLAVVDDWNQRPGPPASGLRVDAIVQESVVMAVPAGHALTQRRGAVTAAALRDIAATQTWLCAPEGQLSRLTGDARLAAIGARPLRRWEFEGLEVLACLVAAGCGVALLPATIVHAQPGIAALALTPRMHRRIVTLTRATVRHDPVIVACLSAVTAALTAQPSPGRGGPTG
jgi:DNA-binding transcriptional LysR family regulator